MSEILGIPVVNECDFDYLTGLFDTWAGHCSEHVGLFELMDSQGYPDPTTISIEWPYVYEVEGYGSWILLRSYLIATGAGWQLLCDATSGMLNVVTDYCSPEMRTLIEHRAKAKQVTP